MIVSSAGSRDVVFDDWPLYDTAKASLDRHCHLMADKQDSFSVMVSTCWSLCMPYGTACKAGFLITMAISASSVHFVRNREDAYSMLMATYFEKHNRANVLFPSSYII
jgi:hypothetical protein